MKRRTVAVLFVMSPSMPASRHGLAGAVLGNRLQMMSGDVQSAGTGVHVHTDSHDVFDLPPS